MTSDRWQVEGVMSHVIGDKWHVARATFLRFPRRAPEFPTYLMPHGNCICESIVYEQGCVLERGDWRLMNMKLYFQKWKLKYQLKGIKHFKNSGALRSTFRRWHLPHITCHGSPVTSDMTHVTCHLSHIKSHRGTVWCFKKPQKYFTKYLLC